MVNRPDPTPRNPGKGALAAVSLATGRSIRETARMLGLNERTVRRWSHAPTFRARVEKHRNEMIDATLGKLASHAAGAVEVIADLMAEADTDATKLAAAKAILDKLPMMHEFFDLSQRVAALEERATEQESPSWRRR